MLPGKKVRMFLPQMNAQMFCAAATTLTVADFIQLLA
jgi:hypothetical protein